MNRDPIDTTIAYNLRATDPRAVLHPTYGFKGKARVPRIECVRASWRISPKKFTALMETMWTETT
jgi:hypothetical protein